MSVLSKKNKSARSNLNDRNGKPKASRGPVTITSKSKYKAEREPVQSNFASFVSLGKKKQFSYLLIGNGRVSHHFQFYFKNLGISFCVWSRSKNLRSSKLVSPIRPPTNSSRTGVHKPNVSNLSEHDLKSLCQKLSQSHRVLLLISDDALKSFYQAYLRHLTDAPIIHFSGSQQIPGILAAHPLMSFSKKLFEPSEYFEIPFVLEKPFKLRQVLPGLSNPSRSISAEKKKLYHALCVMSGNFTTLLWQRAAKDFEKLELPAWLLNPYRHQIFKNLELDLNSALTGPLARKDLKTIRHNLKSLKGHSYQPVYKAFLKAEGVRL